MAFSVCMLYSNRVKVNGRSLQYAVMFVTKTNRSESGKNMSELAYNA